jgi:4'-phosphopantetheinyl transferase EntD
MPLFYQHNINEHTRLGIWRIEEGEGFFLEKVPLKRDVSHPHKRLQHLAGRFLLPGLFADFPLEEIVIADTRKPYLENEKYHFSISHCGQFAAAIVSDSFRVGVDIEMVTEKIKRIQHKFLFRDEYKLADTEWQKISGNKSEEDLLTLLWSSKEAIFKWYSLGNIDFRENMRLSDRIVRQDEEEFILPFEFNKSGPIRVQIRGKFFQEIVLAWVMKDI